MTREEKDKLIELSDLNREDNIKYISSEAQGIAITLDSDRYAPTFCKLERAYICGRRKSEDQIADIKANCDLAIEGRDIKIKELKDRLEDLQEQNSEMFDTIALQEQQIEKMKCCGNCKYSNQESVYSIVCKVGGVDKSDYINIDDNQVCDKWEIKEND